MNWYRGLSFLTLLFLLVSCGGQESSVSPDLVNNPNSAEAGVKTDGLPKMEFVTTEHDFGKITEGVRVSFKFKFKNTGTSPLIISQVKTSCGCTASKFPKTPINPGEENYIELTFDSSHRPGFNRKTATVLANTQPNVVALLLTALVVDK
jgi:hypothetical protein